MLVAHGIPWDVAISMPDETRAGMVIQCVEYEGMYQYDWTARDFKDRPKKGK